jgi:hypothetical protein
MIDEPGAMSIAEPRITEWCDAPVLASHEPPVLDITGRDLLVSYLIARVALSVEDQEECAVVKFGGVYVFTYGYPNDEALPGHPLFRHGLKHYSFNVVENSPRIEEMRKQNAVCFPNSGRLFDHRKHFVVTFQDETLEVVCDEISFLGRYATPDPQEAMGLCLSK